MCKTSRPKISPHPHTFVTLHKPGDHVSPVANYKPMHFKKCPASRAEPHRPFSQKPLSSPEKSLHIKQCKHEKNRIGNRP